MHEDVDVIIVGSGPGGCSAAHFLSRQGCRILMLEKNRLPRYKTCAGGVPDSGLRLFPFSFDQVIEQRIDRFTCVHNQQSVTMEVPDGTLSMVMRDAFDLFLVEHSGAEVLEQKRVTRLAQTGNGVRVHTADGKTYTSHYVIGGDGPHSRVAAAMDLRRHRRNGLALEVEAPVPADILRSFQGRVLTGFDVLPAGYYWVFPKSDHLSVGIGTMIPPNKAPLLPRLREHMSRYGIDISTVRPRAHALSVFTRLERLHRGRVLLVGDAAGLVDPYTGEGIRHALLSGKIAAECILQGRLKEYTRKIHRAIAGDLLWAERLARFFYARQAFSFHYLIRNRYIFQEMLKTITNQTTYKKSIQIWPLYLLHFLKRQPLDCHEMDN
ncbi:MAG: geranylgeranyl reductase family protein [Desulfohalobiaceae bacterium]|nr:geranylgeranyl reductase family protein [Desulfohalobiaceae bacterium]